MIIEEQGMFRSFEMELAGRKLIVETGKMAKQASGFRLIKYETHN